MQKDIIQMRLVHLLTQKDRAQQHPETHHTQKALVPPLQEQYPMPKVIQLTQLERTLMPRVLEEHTQKMVLLNIMELLVLLLILKE